jgi:hypothetical protein
MQSIEIFIVIAGKMQSRRKRRSLRFQDTSIPGRPGSSMHMASARGGMKVRMLEGARGRRKEKAAPR